MARSRVILIAAAIALGCGSSGGGGGGGGGGTGPDTTPPSRPDLSRITVSSPLPGGMSQIEGTNGAVEGSALVKVVNTDTAAEAQSASAGDGSFDLSIPARLGDRLSITATDAAGNESTAASTTAGPIPFSFSGDPGTVAQRVIGGGAGAVEFSFASGGERFMLIVEPQNPGGGVFPVTVIGSGEVSVDRLAGAARPDRFDVPGPEARIRALERDFAYPRLRFATPDQYVRGRDLRGAQDADRDFFVANTPEATEFDVVHANLRFTGDNVLIYVDDRTPPANLTNAMIEEIGNAFDDSIFPTTTGAFGDVSDVDNDGRVIILATPTVNNWTTQELVDQGFQFGGFFFGVDLLPQIVFPNSNEAEMFYVPIPDPAKEFGAGDFPVEFYVEDTRSTTAHELEHMISANEHILERNGQGEDIWLDEGLAHYSETLNGFDLQNLLRSGLFLDSPNATPMVGTNQPVDDTLERRGAVWLLVHYLVDRHGMNILGELVQTSRIGVNNVEQAADTSMQRLLHEFYSMLFLDDQGISNDPVFSSSLNIRNRFDLADTALDGELGPFLGIGTHFVSTNGSSISNTVRGTGAAYLEIRSSTSGTFPVMVDMQANAELQLSIIRIQ